MEQLNQQAKRIGEKLQSLLKRYRELEKENSELKETLAKTRARLEACLEEKASLEQKLAVWTLSSREMNDPEKKEMDKKLQAYIREIDRCIALLQE